MIAVTVDIRCDWCRVMVATTAAGTRHSAIPVADTAEAAAQLLADHRERGRIHQVDDEHVCDSCFRRGRPAAIVPPKPKRTTGRAA